jgi:uncharacterized protein YciI
MAGMLIVLALLGAVVGLFVWQFRRRVRSTLAQAGHELPVEVATRSRPPVATPPGRGAAAVPARAAAVVMPAAQPHFLLIYEVGPDFLQRRLQHRNEHLALAWRAADAGELVLAGALEEGTGQAFLLFRGSREAATRFAQADPYVREGLVRQWRVAQWHTVVGATAAAPLRAASKT